jgi:pimeloyl-ACP methyl ester carboxylesterase
MEREAAEMEQGSLRSMVLRLTPPGQPVPAEEDIKVLSEAYLVGKDRFALASVRRSNRNQAISAAQMAAVTVPTLAIVGSADPKKVKVEELKEVMPSLKVVVIDGATHGGDRSAARRPEFVQAIRDFIAAHRGT